MKDFLAYSVILVCASLFMQADKVQAQPNAGSVTESPFHVKYLTIDDGLSDNSVTCLLKDRYGFLWAGTANGLNRYDGFSFRIFKHSDEPSSISHNRILKVFEDSRGDLWVGTGFGLNRYDRKSGNFIRYMPGRSVNHDSLTHGSIVD